MPIITPGFPGRSTDATACSTCCRRPTSSRAAARNVRWLTRRWRGDNGPTPHPGGAVDDLFVLIRRRAMARLRAVATSRRGRDARRRDPRGATGARSSRRRSHRSRSRSHGPDRSRAPSAGQTHAGPRRGRRAVHGRRLPRLRRALGSGLERHHRRRPAALCCGRTASCWVSRSRRTSTASWCAICTARLFCAASRRRSPRRSLSPASRCPGVAASLNGVTFRPRGDHSSRATTPPKRWSGHTMPEQPSHGLLPRATADPSTAASASSRTALLFRHDRTDRAHVSDDAVATATVLSRVRRPRHRGTRSARTGLRQRRQALLLGDALEFLPKEQIVLRDPSDGSP